MRLAFAVVLSLTLLACDSDGDPASTSSADTGVTTDGATLADVSGDASVSGPDGTITQPDGTITQPDGVVVTPDGGPTPDVVVIPDVPKPPTSPLVDPNCTDGQYAEVPHPNTADLSAELAAYNPADPKAFIAAVLQKCYPIGAYLVEGGLGADGFGDKDCVDAFLSPSNDGVGVVNQLSTIVHECGHFFDIADFFSPSYYITDTVRFQCPGLGYQGPNAAFARSLINTDQWSQLHEPCEGFGGFGCDGYAAIYLDGDPNDASFQGGDQGFDSLLEETVQYVNSLATGHAFQDAQQFSVSERDGILTFLWYVMRYLHMARNDYPAVYQHITNTACWRDAILTVWGRAWIYLGVTEGNSKLGINDAFLATLVDDATLLNEIALLRKASGCN